MDFFRKLLGIDSYWDGRDRRSSLRARCDFDLEVTGPGVKFRGRALDASPRGIRVRVRAPWSARQIKRGSDVQLKYLKPLAEGELDTVRGRVGWIKRLNENLFLLAISFQDTMDHLRHSWVKSVLMRGMSTRVRQQRGFVRVQCDLAVNYLLQGRSYEGRLTDLSVQGGRLEASKSFAQGSHLDVRLGPLGDLPRLSLHAVVRRAELQERAICYGLTFLIDEAARKSVLRYVQALLEAPPPQGGGASTESATSTS